MTPSEAIQVRLCTAEGCGGLVVPTRKDGRYYPYANIVILVPVNHPIPRCEDCGEEYMTNDEMNALTAILDAEYDKQAEMIDKIRKWDPRDPRGVQN